MEEESNSSNSTICPPRFGWWPYITSYLVVFITGLVIMGLMALLQALSSKTRRFVTILKNKLILLMDKNKIVGKIHFIITVFCNLVYMCLMVTRSSGPVYNCNNNDNTMKWSEIFELLISIYLLMDCMVVVFTDRKPWCRWIKPNNLFDIMTLSHSFVSLFCGYDWQGLRSLRFMSLPHIIEELIKMSPWKRVRSEDFMKLGAALSRFAGFWLASSGIIQLLENEGDSWKQDSTMEQQAGANNDTMTFWSGLYLAMVTLSTVGYGDITMRSSTGKIFIVLFILLGVLVYALSVPVLIEFLLSYNQKSKFQQVYSGNNPLEHLLIVIGRITEESVNSFLKELLHPDKGDTKTYVIFLHSTPPTPNLCSIMKKYYTRVQYYKGSPLSVTDLISCGIQHAKSVVVLANRQCSNPFAEDHSNLLMVAFVKKTCPSVQVILQLLNYHSKVFLSSLFGWDLNKDAVLCLNEWKMRTLAQTCLTPGFNTLFSNLFFATSANQRKTTNNPSWKQLYIAGACHEVYSTHFSSSFFGLKISETANICYKELGLSLLAVSSHHTIINRTTIGYFMTDQSSDVKSVSIYCSKCHGRDSVTIKGSKRRIKSCTCAKMSLIANGDHIEQEEVFSSLQQSIQTNIPSQPLVSLTSISPLFHTLPITHLEPPRPQDDADSSPLRMIPRSYTHSSPLSSPPITLNNHIVLCIFANEDSTPIGLASFLTPLQASQQSVVIVSENEYFIRELSFLQSTQGLYFLPGLPLISTSLKEARVDTCKICIVLSAPRKEQENSQVLYGTEDKEVILCALKLRHQLGDKVRIISDLTVESHIHLLDTGDSNWDEPAYLADTFAFGEIFLSSVFDSLTTVIFHNPGINHLLESLMFTSNLSNSNYESSVITFNLTSNYIGASYQDLYSDKTKENVLCIGIHRQVAPESTQRYIITAPPSHVTLLSEDVILALAL